MSKVFIVLGMHRSATSLVAGGLHKMDVDMGSNLLGAGVGNPKGHFENIDFINLNDRILNSAGGSWNNPPSEGAILDQASKYAKDIQEVISKNKSELWGWKDPRTVLTINLYLPYLENPHFIFVFRDYKEVAKSLNKRDNMPIDAGIKLAKEYNKRLLKIINKYAI